VDVCTYQLG